MQQILSPNPDDSGVWIHQNAWFHLGNLDNGSSLNYELRNPETNGVYAFVIKGDVTINGQELNERDGYGLWNLSEIDIEANSDTDVLLMEVPMN